jgi:hypothetical protein
MIDAETTYPSIFFALPPEFTEIPLDDDVEVRGARIAEIVQHGLDTSPEEYDEQAIAEAVALWVVISQNIEEEGAQFGALMIAPKDDGSESDTMTLAMMFAETQIAPPAIAVTGVLEILTRRLPNADVRVIELPCGPAVAAVEQGAYHFPAELHPDHVAVDLPQGRFQVYIPVPDQPWMVVFDMTTSAVDQWDDCCEMMAGVMRTVAFEGASPAAEGRVIEFGAWAPDYGTWAPVSATPAG